MTKINPPIVEPQKKGKLMLGLEIEHPLMMEALVLDEKNIEPWSQ